MWYGELGLNDLVGDAILTPAQRYIYQERIVGDQYHRIAPIETVTTPVMKTRPSSVLTRGFRACLDGSRVRFKAEHDATPANSRSGQSSLDLARQPKRTVTIPSVAARSRGGSRDTGGSGIVIREPMTPDWSM